AGHALCVTAAHILEWLYDILDIPSRRTPGVAPCFQVRRPHPEQMIRAIRAGYVRATAKVGDRVAAPTLTVVSYLEEFDVGLVGLASNIYEDGHLPLDINSDSFKPGTPVLALRSYEPFGGEASQPG